MLVREARAGHALAVPTSLTAVVPVVAALRTPTVRLRYLAARAVPDLVGLPDVPALLARRDRVRAVLDRGGPWEGRPGGHPSG